MKLKLLLFLLLTPTTVPLFAQSKPPQPEQQAKVIPPPPSSATAKPAAMPVNIPEPVKDKLLIAYHKALEAQMSAQIVQTQAQTAQQASQTATQAYMDLQKSEAKAMGLPESTQFTVDISKDLVSAPPQAPQNQNQAKN